jgi:hypothetical protein
MGVAADAESRRIKNILYAYSLIQWFHEDAK